MKNISLCYLNQNNRVGIISLSEMSEEDEPVESIVEMNFVSYDRIMELVESLPEGYSKVFKLAVLEGLPHKEIGELLHIAPHSSSSQLSRAKLLLKKMINEHRLALLLLLLSFVPLLYKYVYRHPRRLPKTFEDIAQQAETEKEEKTMEGQKLDSPNPIIHSIPVERPQPLEKLTAPPLIPANTPPLLSSEKITFDLQSVAKPLFIGELAYKPLFTPCPTVDFVSPGRSRKSNKWKFMLAGSLGPQLAQNLYKLIATPHADSEGNPDLPQQVSTWEEYYTYLQTRYQEGLSGDSLSLCK